MLMNDNFHHILSIAQQNAKEHKHEYVTVEHVLYIALFFEDFQKYLNTLDVSTMTILEKLEEYFNNHVPIIQDDFHTIPLSQTSALTQVWEKMLNAKNSSTINDPISNFLLPIMDLPSDIFAKQILETAGLSKMKILSYHNISLHSFANNEYDVQLPVYLSDYTHLAYHDNLEICIGREKLILEILSTLMRREKNNVLLLGEEGVGKKSLLRGLAYTITKNNVPLPFKKTHLYHLNILSFLNARYREDADTNLRKFIETQLTYHPVIIFITQLSRLINPNYSNLNGVFDFTQLMGHSHSKYPLRFILSSSFQENKKFLERSQDLHKIFKSIIVPEPNSQETLLILNKAKKQYEKYHKVKFNKSSLQQIIDLSRTYFYDGIFPAKALNLMDETGAFMRTNHIKPAIVNKDILEQVVLNLTGQTALHEHKQIAILKNLKHNLSKHIFGQENSIDQIVNVLKRYQAGFKKMKKPIASLFFVGFTGVGKTELAIQLAQLLEISFHRFDMSEYQEKHAISKLVGSPPGYVGFDEGGILVDVVRKNPHTVLLFDEIEKAHPDVYNLFLQIMDDATLTEGNGRKADFCNTIIIFTSNVGSNQALKKFIGFSQENHNIFSPDFQSAIEKQFNTEFINRLDLITTFSSLSKETIDAIIRRELNTFTAQLKNKGILLHYDNSVYPYLSQKGFSPIYGARYLNRIIEEKIKDLFVDLILFKNPTEILNLFLLYDNKRDTLVLKKMEPKVTNVHNQEA